MQKGKASLWFNHPSYLMETACIAGNKEGEGPLGSVIDQIEPDATFGAPSWEEAESILQKRTANLALEKNNLCSTDIRYLFAGDLLGQLIATSFGTAGLQIPMFGLYGACSSIAEALCLGSMCIDAGHADRVMALASSHYASAEKEFRFPLGYGNQRPSSAAWTVTGCGALILSGSRGKSKVKISGITTGRAIDPGIRDSMNMGAAMAPAAWDTIRQNFEDFQVNESWYDQIITGDLGKTGTQILFDFMSADGCDIRNKHTDCGLVIYDNDAQDTHSGGSGCGCAALVLCSYILPHLADGTWRRVLFLPTGALLSTISYNEGQNIPGICHGVILESTGGTQT